MTMENSTERRLCCVCGDEVDPDEAHWRHEDGCPVPELARLDRVPGALEVRAALAACSCDLLAHPECCECPPLLEPLATRDDQLRSVSDRAKRFLSRKYYQGDLRMVRDTLNEAAGLLREFVTAVADPEHWPCDDWCPYGGLVGHRPVNSAERER
jgi:hypothetical protein